MAQKINLAQMSPKFASMQEALAKAKTPEEKIEIMLALSSKTRRIQEIKIRFV